MISVRQVKDVEMVYISQSDKVISVHQVKDVEMVYISQSDLGTSRLTFKNDNLTNNA